MKRNEKYLVVLLIVYLSLFIAKKSGFYFPIISDYLADLVCLPISLLFITWFSAKLSGKRIDIGWRNMLMAVFYFTVVFELWMPSISENYTADILDVICYFSGGMFYLTFLKNESESSVTI
jgi:hypothetical protein